MSQITWRTTEGLVARVRLQADHLGLSMNEYVTRVMQAATDPSYSQEPSDQVRERLRLAGLLAAQPPDAEAKATIDEAAVDGGAVEAARARAGTGTSLASLVTGDR